MSDKVLTINLTEREIDLLHECISTNMETVKRRHDVTGSTADLLQELGELSDDLFEQLHRRNDDWEGRTFVLAEDDMIQRGMDAREQAKMHSRAADRRALGRALRSAFFFTKLAAGWLCMLITKMAA